MTNSTNMTRPLLALLLTLSTIILPALSYYNWHSPAQLGLQNTPYENTQSPVSSDLTHNGKTERVGTVNVGRLQPSHSRTGRADPPRITLQEGTPLQTRGGSTPGKISTKSQSSIGISTIFDGIDSTVECCNSPPDVQVAAGPNHIVEFVNIDGEIFTKQGIPTSIFPLRTFFNISPSHSLADPKILYDTLSQRWFASIIDYARFGGQFSESRVIIAASASSDPTGLWNLYALVGTFSLGPNPVFGITDQPILGVSDDKITISVNDFALTNSQQVTFIGAEYWVVSKADLLNGSTTLGYARFGPYRDQFSVHPIRSLGSTTTQYMVTVGAIASRLCVACTPQLFQITGVPPGNVTVKSIPFQIQSLSSPPDVPQPGSDSISLDVPDTRVQDAVWFQGSLWFATNTGCTPTGDTELRSCIRIVQVNTSNLSVVQSFDYGARDTYYFYPAISIDGAGNMVMVYGYSSATSYPSVAVTGQALGDGMNSLATPKTLVNGSAPDISGRYGDYFGAATDPTDQTLVWVAGEYLADNDSLCFFNCWSTKVGSASILGYAVAPDSPALTIQPGQSAKSTLAISSLSGFTGSITLSASSTDPRVIPAISPAEVRLSAGGTVSPTLTISTDALANPGNYTVSVNTKSGRLVRSVNVKITVPDFSISSAAKTSSILVGSSSPISRVKVESSNGFTGTVNLSPSVSPPTGLTCSLNPTSVTFTTSPSSTLECTSTVSGTYAIQVVATVGRLSRSVSTIVTVSPFSVALDSTTISLQAGASVTSTVMVASLAGFSGSVNMSARVSPAGPQLSLSSTNLILQPGENRSLQLTFATTNVLGGNYTVRITGQTGVLSYSTNVAFIVSDYVLAHRGTVLAFTGDNVTFQVDISSTNHFTGTINLSASSPNGPTCSISPAIITLVSPAVSNVTCTGATASYIVKIEGASGVTLHTLPVPIILIGLSISTESDSILVAQGSFSQTTMTVQASGFQGSLTSNLSVANLPDGVTLDFSPNPLTLSSRYLAVSFLTFGADDSVPPGTYNLTLTTEVHGLSRSAPLQLRVLLPTVGFTQTTNFAGIHVEHSLTASVNTLGSNTISGIATVTATDTSNTPILASNFTLTASMNQDGVARYVIELSTSPYWISIRCEVNTMTNTPACVLTRTPDVNHDNTIDQQDSLNVSESAGCSTGSACYDPTLDLNADGAIDESDVQAVQLFERSTVVPPPQFLLSSDKSSISFPVGTLAGAAISLVSINGFSGTTNLTVSPSPGLSCSLTSSSIDPQNTRPVGLACTSQSSGVYNATIVGVSGIISNSVTITFTTVPFNIAAGSEPILVQAGSTLSSNITLTSLSGFSGVITVSAKASPQGPAVSLSRTSVLLNPDETGTVAITVSNTSIAPGNYTLTITGETGQSSFSTTRPIRITDFRVSGLFATSIPVVSSYSQTLMVTGLNGFKGPIVLTANVSPSGFTCTTNNIVITSTLPTPSTVNCTPTTGGSYRLVVTGIAGPTSHSTTATVDVFDYTVTQANASSIIRRNSFTTNSAEININPQYPTFSTILLTSTSPRGVSVLFGGNGRESTFGNGAIRIGFFTTRTETIGLTVVVDSSVPVGVQNVTVTVFGSRVIRTISINITVPNFRVTATENTLRFRARSTGTILITLTSLEHFTGTVQLTSTASRPSLHCALSPASASLADTAAIILTCIGSPGKYTLTVTGAGASISHSITIRVSVTG